ncbi:ATP-binding cassette domain-containing protein [Acidianus sulfidivorans JP7]|uniref:Oligopeptide ABC transporter ATP-binding protein n=1 Tax=Acidianus sulfidivorans JP7 TaxID=619593 RepID=A0A2U9ILV4_9CREN|nr:ABC transporter ATP-binding protein [Acidianus sulfidivorans]AWR96894.1 ATP-binding cassette domain-containing protein [Acidianus sulfidivorans JP7]
MLETKDLKVYFKSRGKLIKAVDKISISLDKGKILGIVGESGSGKTTLIRAIIGTQKIDGGSILFNGRDMSKFKSKDWKEFRRSVQMIYQDPFDAIDPRYKVYDTVAEGLRAQGLVNNKEEEKKLVYETLERVNLTPPEKFAEAYVTQLSGGQLQRVSIARSLILKPSIILADEPVSMLDVSIRAGILNIFTNLREVDNVGFAIVSHDISTLAYVADELVIMYMGKLMESGNTDEVIEKPLNPYTQALLSAVPVPDPLYKNPNRVMLKGEISYEHFKYGCRLYPRCPFAMDICAKEEPKIIEVSPGHKVACHLFLKG